MNPQRYKLMISYLPGMAAVVNSFQSPDVQKSVFDSLMEALNAKMEAESTGAGTGTLTTTRTRVSAPSPRLHAASSSLDVRESRRVTSGDDIAHDLSEGESIHSMSDRQESIP